MTTVFVTLLFSAGLPILLPFAALTLLITRQLDRFCILRTTPQPPAYDHRLTTAFRGIMKVAVLCHICVASYMLGNADILNTAKVYETNRRLQGGGANTGLTDRIFQSHVFPLTFTGALYLGGERDQGCGEERSDECSGNTTYLGDTLRSLLILARRRNANRHSLRPCGAEAGGGMDDFG